MSRHLNVAVEIGPKGKKVAAYSPDWPGLSRGATTEEKAVETLRAYVPRYAPIAAAAGLAASFPANGSVNIVERYTGTGSTDFWGISFARTEFDNQPMLPDELDRELALMQSCWAFFDDVRARVSPVLRKGPRGGGRDRDQIARHTIVAYHDWGKGLGLQPPEGDILDERSVQDYRAAYVSAIRAYHAEGRMSGKWPLRFLIRHTAYHTLDHAWEMEDKDLTGETG